MYRRNAHGITRRVRQILKAAGFMDDGDQVTSVTTADPDGAGPQQRQATDYDYDSRGRRTTTTLPDAETVHFEYHDTGELAKTYGARTIAYTDPGQIDTETYTAGDLTGIELDRDFDLTWNVIACGGAGGNVVCTGGDFELGGTIGPPYA
ncbi:MAG: hypothetical protein HQ592_12125, partial [Planctomycetes bacterium]|nr:hypothetical protein [Planctomycetota bacterium]